MRSKDYQRLLNSKRWKMLRASYLQEHPLCERCKEQGFVTSAIDLHHKVPVETGRTLAEMEQLCFDRQHNLMALCRPCHLAIHAEMRSHSKEVHKQRADERLARWIERNTTKRR
jgi:5-methylcytosine-specific restriction protein A